MSPVKTHIFPNGFRFIYEKSTNVLPITSVNIFCDVGSAHETPALRGASHFIEHMCFKGTKKRPTAKEIFVEYDKIGADFNAFTVKRFTCYVFKCDSKYVDKSIDILSDMMLNSTFPAKEYEREHKVVVEENVDNENDPEDQIYVYTDKMLYAETAFAHPVDDTSYHEKGALSRDSVVDFYTKYYRPNNMVLSIVTDVSFENIKRILQRSFFVKTPQDIVTPVGKLLSTGIAATTDGIQFDLVHKRGVENILFTAAFRVCGNSNPDKYKLDVLSNLLSGTMSGRLFMDLREKTGLIYSSNIETNLYDNYGDFTIFTQTEAHLIIRGAGGGSGKQGLLPMFVNIFNNLVKNGITQRELDITKGYIKGTLLIETEDVNTACEYNGTQMLMGNGEIVPYKELYKSCYENITVKEMNETIRKYVKREHMCVCLLGEKLPSLKAVEKVFAAINF